MYYSVHQSRFLFLFEFFLVFGWHKHHDAEMGRAGCGGSGKRTERLHQMRHVINGRPVVTMESMESEG
jgi:hypothetical protein